MKRTYINPTVEMELFAIEEILTDIVSASTPDEVAGGSWDDFIA